MISVGDVRPTPGQSSWPLGHPCGDGVVKAPATDAEGDGDA